MNRLTAWMTVFAFASITPFAYAAEGTEEEDTTVTQSELPSRVAETVKEYGQGGDFDHAVKADEDGVAVYEVVLKKGDRIIEVQTTLDGELNMREERINPDVLPKAVVERAAKAHPGATLKGAEKTIRSVYEVQLTDAKGKRVEVLVTPGGQLVAEPEALDEKGGESEADEKEEKEEKGHKASKASGGNKSEKHEKSEKKSEDKD
jgi:hypothetical protein